MKRVAAVLLLLAAAFFSGYFIGQANEKVKFIEIKVKEINNVAQKRAVIQAEPNASRTELLELMRAGEL